MLKRIEYYTRRYTGSHECIDEKHEAYVLGLAFVSGELHYFKLDSYNYLVLHKGNDGNWYR